MWFTGNKLMEDSQADCVTLINEEDCEQERGGSRIFPEWNGNEEITDHPAIFLFYLLVNGRRL